MPFPQPHDVADGDVVGDVVPAGGRGAAGSVARPGGGRRRRARRGERQQDYWTSILVGASPAASGGSGTDTSSTPLSNRARTSSGFTATGSGTRR